jgi:phosphoribosylanthranilate isomerase
MSTIVKICGLATQDGLDAALAAGADMVGFVFFDKSPRHVSLDRAGGLGGRVAGRANKVLLTVDADDALLAAAIAALDPQFLQLHGAESPARIASIRARFGLPVMKAIGVDDAPDPAQIRLFEAVADMLLFDAKPRPDAARPGGNGAGFDWTLLDAVETRRPWLLAGGLDAGNVAAALASTRAHGVDVSSGVESAPGAKDPGRIAAFVAEVRAAARSGGKPGARGAADERLGPARRNG